MGSNLEMVAATTTAADGAPTVVTCGLMLDDGPAEWPFRLRVTDAEEARGAVDRLASAGVDFIKVHHLLSREAYLAAIEAAKGRRLPVAAHVPHSVSIHEAVDAGQKTMEHLAEFRLTQECLAGCDAVLRTMRERGVYNTPTVVSLRSISASGASIGRRKN
jgi:imidazolonepropionase-like amidohydrolase